MPRWGCLPKVRVNRLDRGSVALHIGDVRDRQAHSAEVDGVSPGVKGVLNELADHDLVVRAFPGAKTLW